MCGSAPTAGAGWRNACALGLLIVPATSPARRRAFTPLSDTEAFFSLALHAFNLLSHGAAGSEAVGLLAAQCSCYALTMSDLDEACGRARTGGGDGAGTRGKPGRGG